MRTHQTMPAIATAMPAAFLGAMVSWNSTTPPARMMSVLTWPTTLYVRELCVGGGERDTAGMPWKMEEEAEEMCGSPDQTGGRGVCVAHVQRAHINTQLPLHRRLHCCPLLLPIHPLTHTCTHTHTPRRPDHQKGRECHKQPQQRTQHDRCYCASTKMIAQNCARLRSE